MARSLQSESRGSLLFFAAMMFLAGMMMAETGAALERMTSALGLNASQQGLLVSVRFVGGLVVGLILWIGHARVRFKEALAGALVLVIASGPLLFWNSYASALAISSLRGLAIGMVIPLSGMFAAAQRRWHSGFVASAINATLSGGLVLLSLFAAVLAAGLEARWELYWAPASALAVLLLAGLPAISFPPSRDQESGAVSAEQMEAGRAQAGPAEGEPAAAAGHAEAATVELSRNPLKTTNWAYAAAGLFLVGSEGTLLGLMPAQSVTVSSSGLGGEVLALLLMSGMFVGRVAGTKLFSVTTVTRVLTGSATILVVAAALWSLVPEAAPVMLFLLGCATANLFPGTISHISETRPWAASATIAALGCTGGLGGTVVPALAGTALDLGLSVHLVSSFVIVPTVIAYALVRSVELNAAARPAR